MIPTLPHVTHIVTMGRVPVPHTNEAEYALDARGRKWVAKREDNMGYQALLAEAVTWLLARHVGLPVPDAAFCDAPAARAWLSGYLPDAKHWSAKSAGAVIANAPQAAGILALDAVICNEARHSGNLLMVEGDGGGIALVAIDADEALIGHPHDLANRGITPPNPRILAPGFPPPGWRKDACTWAERLAALPKAELTDMVLAACAVAQEPDVAETIAVLADRCANAHMLTNAYFDLIEARK